MHQSNTPSLARKHILCLKGDQLQNQLFLLRTFLSFGSKLDPRSVYEHSGQPLDSTVDQPLPTPACLNNSKTENFPNVSWSKFQSEHICSTFSINDLYSLVLLLTWPIIKDKINRGTQLHFPLRMDFRFWFFSPSITFVVSKHPILLVLKFNLLFSPESPIWDSGVWNSYPQTQSITMLKTAAYLA